MLLEQPNQSLPADAADAARLSLVVRRHHGEEEKRMMEYTAVVKKEGDWWIGWIEEIPGVNCQESTRHELLETLRVTRVCPRN